jgi:hypothetical protein
MRHVAWILSITSASLVLSGCASMKTSDTSRTGVEQLLVSSAIDRSLDKVDLRPIAGAKVYLEQKYLDCVDKNYLIVAMHQRLLRNNCTIVEKAEDAQVICEVGSGGIGTDRQDLFVGVPKMSVPAPLPVSIPEVTFFNRTRANGTAKILVVAYDASTKQPVLNSGTQLARSDHKTWSVLGSGHIVSGSVPKELEKATGEMESVTVVPTTMAANFAPTRK